jgi:hypothetical protein
VGKAACAGCGAPHPETFLDLGILPLANSYLSADALAKHEPRFRLAVAYCPACHLVQLTDMVPPEDLFSNYLYFSSYSESFLRHARAMASELTERFSLGAGSFVLEIASNDGYLLKNFVGAGIPVLGVEPAENVAEVARMGGVPTVSQFFGLETARALRQEHGPADVMIGNNVLAHVPEINGFIAGVRAMIKDKTGVGVFEAPWLKPFLDKTEFDTTYHEHVYYYSLTALAGLFKRAGMEIFDVSVQPVHGGSLRVFVCPTGARAVGPAVGEMLALERAAGLTHAATYREYAAKVRAVRDGLRALLRRLKAEGRSIAAYGAAAKGTVMLNYCGIGAETLDYVVDRNPHKQGRYMPGVHVPIHGPEKADETRPDYLLILAWNFQDEIMEQMAHIRAWGGRFILPIPEVRVVE